MSVEIFPAILAQTTNQFRSRLNLGQSVSRWLHIDLMDGKFVPTRSPGPKALQRIRITHPVEVHCMVEHPEQWIHPLLHWPTRRVILPVELGASLRPIFAVFRSRKIPVGLAINPTTLLSKIRPWAKFIESITVMGVTPGRYGATYHAHTVRRVRTLRRLYPRKTLACDGGITPTNLTQLVQAGARRFSVGSFLMQHSDPMEAMRALKTASRG